MSHVTCLLHLQRTAEDKIEESTLFTVRAEMGEKFMDVFKIFQFHETRLLTRLKKFLPHKYLQYILKTTPLTYATDN